MYDQEANKKLGGFFGFTASIAGKAHMAKETFGAIKVCAGKCMCVTVFKAAVQLQQVQKEVEKLPENERGNLDKKVMEEGLQAFFKIGWFLCKNKRLNKRKTRY